MARGSLFATRSLLAIIVLASVVVCTPSMLSQGVVKEPNWHVVNLFRQQQGVPQNSIISILQTSDGYIWIGTKGGLSRFDGVQFTTYDNRNKEQLRENEVWALVEGDDKSLWIGTYGGGLSRLKDGHFTVYTTAEGLVNDFVASLSKDPEGGIWIGTDDGLSRFKDGKFTNYKVQDGLAHPAIRAVYGDRDGSVWVGTNKGALHRLKDGQIFHESLPATGSEIWSILRDRQGRLWVSSYKGLFNLHEGETTHYSQADGLSADRVRALHEDAEGTIWIGTAKGINSYRDGKFQTLDIAGQISSPPNMNAIYSDSEGSLWVAVGGGGIARLHRGQFASYSTRDGLVYDSVTCSIQDDYGRLWIGTWNGLNSLSVDGVMSQHILNPDLATLGVVSLGKDREGNIWIGTNGGLYRTSSPAQCKGTRCDARFELLKNESVPDMHVKTIFQDRDGAMWMGTNLEGLVRYKDGKFTTYTTEHGLLHNAVRGLAQDREGNLWLGTRGGLNRFKDGKFYGFTEKDGLASNAIETIYLDADQTLWIGTRQGMNSLKAGKFTTYTVNDGLYFNYVNAILEDGHGNVWMACSKGVFRVRKQALDDFAAGKIFSFTSVAYGIEHGLSSTVAAAGYHPSGYRTADGRLWFATGHGLNVIDPSKLQLNDRPPPVHVESVTVDQQIMSSIGAGEAPPGRGDLVFRYAALSFLAPEKVKFKYRLEGFDRDWIDAGDRRVAFYNNIPPGNYTFRVIACSNDGVWNETGASYALQLQPHFTQTYLFYGLCALVVFIAAGGVFRLRMRQMRLRERELVSLVSDRTKSLREEVSERVRAEEALRHAHDKLEQRVAERTAELARVNATLQSDIAGRVRAEDALRVSEERLRLALDAAHMVTWDWNTVTNEVTWSAQFERVFGVPKDGQSGSLETFLTRVHPEDREFVTGLLARDVEKATDHEMEFRIVWPDGTVRWLVGAGMFLRDANGAAIRLIGASVDITSRKEAEEQIKQSLREKEVLLKEIHHRVKNNLQVISSLLSLQAGYVSGRPAFEMFRESQNRVRSMALIHERLYRSKDLARLDFDEYIGSLTAHLMRSYGSIAGQIDLKLDVAGALLNVDTAIPCGLIINELISNSLKHAFPNGTKGEIYVGMSLGADNRYRLNVRDNGIGLPPGLDFKNTDTLGLQLVNTLTEQLEGVIEVEDVKGAAFRITFEELKYKERV